MIEIHGTMFLFLFLYMYMIHCAFMFMTALIDFNNELILLQDKT